MSFPSKSDREKCWSARDELWKCLDKNPDNPDACAKFRDFFKSSCPSQWVKHFDRKREYLKFKDKIEKEGVPRILDERLDVVEGDRRQIPGQMKEDDRRVQNSSPNARIFRKFQPPTYR